MKYTTESIRKRRGPRKLWISKFLKRKKNRQNARKIPERATGCEFNERGKVRAGKKWRLQSGKKKKRDAVFDPTAARKTFVEAVKTGENTTGDSKEEW